MPGWYVLIEQVDPTGILCCSWGSPSGCTGTEIVDVATLRGCKLFNEKEIDVWRLPGASKKVSLATLFPYDLNSGVALSLARCK